MRKLIGFVLFSLFLLVGYSVSGDDVQQSGAESEVVASVEMPEGVVEVGSKIYSLCNQ